MPGTPSKTVNVIGSGGHARAVVQLLQNLGYSVNGVYDVSYSPSEEELIVNVPLAGTPGDLPSDTPVVLAAGKNDARKKDFEQYGERVLADNLVHPRACVEPSVKLGRANSFLAMSYVNAEVQMGNNNIINSGAVIEHESRIGNHNHISVGTLICGRVTIGDQCFIGAGAVIKDNVSICDHVLVGAGAVVVRDITEPGTYVGCPARPI